MTRTKKGVATAQAATQLQQKSITIKEINSLSDYIHEVQSISDTAWFRGHGMSEKYALRPSPYRDKPNAPRKTFEELNDTEYDMIKKFKFKSLPFVNENSISDDLETLFFMQHYSIPTRLLDWSENPNVALYFALHDPYNYDTKLGYIEDCAVWIIKPLIWNRCALNLDMDYGILSSKDQPMNGYLPPASRGANNMRSKYPVAIEGRLNNPRIVAQQGVFMIFGTDLRDMKDMFLDPQFSEDALIKLVIPKHEIENMRLSLYKMGVRDSAIYPDLEGLAKEIKRDFKL